MKWAFLPIPQYAKVHKSVGIGKALRQKAERKQSKRVGAYMDRSAVLNKLTEQYLYSSTQILSRQYWSTYKEVLEILSLYFSHFVSDIFFSLRRSFTITRHNSANAKRSSLAEGKSNLFMNFYHLDRFEKCKTDSYPRLSK